MRDAIELLGIRLLRGLSRTLPAPMALACGRFLGRLAFAVGVRRNVCLENLERALGPVHDAPSRRRLARRTYEHVGMLAMEFLRHPVLSLEARRGQVDFGGIDHMRRATQERGAILATAHLGNWEILAAGAVAHELPLTVVVQRLRNRRVDALLWRSREELGLRNIERGMGLRRLQGELEARRLVALLCDQDAKRRGLFVPFFGVPASTPTGAAQLALRLGVPFIPCFGKRLPDGRHAVCVHPPVAVPPGLDEGAAVRFLMERFHALLEAAIRAEPSQYFWLHRRWKTRPRVDSSDPPARGPA